MFRHAEQKLARLQVHFGLKLFSVTFTSPRPAELTASNTKVLAMCAWLPWEAAGIASQPSLWEATILCNDQLWPNFRLRPAKQWRDKPGNKPSTWKTPFPRTAPCSRSVWLRLIKSFDQVEVSPVALRFALARNRQVPCPPILSFLTFLTF